MIKSLSDILVVSDMDGTLLVNNSVLPPSNLETIRLFTMLGGRFTVATGRVTSSILRQQELVKCLSPGITNNGCVLYDFNNQVTLRSEILPRSAGKRALDDILRNFPKAGAVVMAANNRLYLAKASPNTQKLLNDEQHTFYLRPGNELPDDWNKVLFAADPKTLEEIQEYVSQKEYPGIYYVATDPSYFEMMPQGVNKGEALKNLCNVLEVPLENTIVIGDYYNDVEMMKVAGYAVAMGNAPREIKILANETTGRNDEGGVGQFLYKLVRKYG